jgi:hypothetical protein
VQFGCAVGRQLRNIRESSDLRAIEELQRNVEGKADLRIYIGQRGDYVVEAKQGPSCLDSDKNQVRKDINDYLSEAVKDVVCAGVDGKAKRLGIAFLVPWSSKSPNGKAIHNWIKKVPFDKKVIAIWTFPGVARTIKYSDGGKKYYCPGVLLLARRPRG